MRSIRCSPDSCQVAGSLKTSASDLYPNYFEDKGRAGKARFRVPRHVF